jgi:hypothetical protein
MSLPDSVAIAQFRPHSKRGWVCERGSGGNGDFPSQRNSDFAAMPAADTAHVDFEVDQQIASRSMPGKTNTTAAGAPKADLCRYETRQRKVPTRDANYHCL